MGTTSERLTTLEAARLIGIDGRTLKRLRIRGEGPPCEVLNLGAQQRARYRRADVLAWIEANRTRIGSLDRDNAHPRDKA